MPLTETTPALRRLRGRHDLVGAEIGVYRGEGASFYLKELDIKCVYLIDPYMDYENYSSVGVGLKNLSTASKMAHKRLYDYKQKIKWTKKKSSEAVKLIANNSLDFVYIDGNHSYDSVMEDILLYCPKLKSGGLLSGHDYDLKGVKEAVDNFIKMYGLILHTQGGAGMEKKYDWWTWKN